MGEMSSERLVSDRIHAAYHRLLTAQMRSREARARAELEAKLPRSFHWLMDRPKLLHRVTLGWDAESRDWYETSG